MAAICPRWGCLKKSGGWKWEGSLKKPDVIRSPSNTSNKRQKKLGNPSAVGFFWGEPARWTFLFRRQDEKTDKTERQAPLWKFFLVKIFLWVAVMRGRRRVSFFRPRTVGPCRPALPPSGLPPSRPRRTPLNPHSKDQTLSTALSSSGATHLVSTGSLSRVLFANRR